MTKVQQRLVNEYSWSRSSKAVVGNGYISSLQACRVLVGCQYYALEQQENDALNIFDIQQEKDTPN